MQTNTNPYSTPSTSEIQPAIREGSSTKRLCVAYGIAPLIAPLFAAITVFIIGFVYQTTHPDDVDVNPMALIFAPVFLLIAGVPSSYSVAGLIGMPIAFSLRKWSRLNGYTVHGAALLLAAVLALGLAMAGVLSASLQSRDLPSFIEFLGGALAMFLALAPFILLSATAFWLIGVRRWKQ